MYTYIAYVNSKQTRTSPKVHIRFRVLPQINSLNSLIPSLNFPISPQYGYLRRHSDTPCRNNLVKSHHKHRAPGEIGECVQMRWT